MTGLYDATDATDPAGLAGVEPQPDPRAEPYLSLFTAVLVDAFILQNTCRRARERGARIKPGLIEQLVADEEWVRDDDDTRLFSFVPVCLFLGLSPDAVRRKYLTGEIYGKTSRATNRAD